MKKMMVLLLATVLSFSCSSQKAEIRPTLTNEEVIEILPEQGFIEQKIDTTEQIEYYPATFGTQSRVAESEGLLFNYLISEMLSSTTRGYKFPGDLTENIGRISQQLEYIEIMKDATYTPSVQFGNLIWDNPYPLPKLKSIRIKGFDIKSLDGLSEWFPSHSDIAIVFENCRIDGLIELNKLGPNPHFVSIGSSFSDLSSIAEIHSFKDFIIYEREPTITTVEQLKEVFRRRPDLIIDYNRVPIEDIDFEDLPLATDVFYP